MPDWNTDTKDLHTILHENPGLKEIIYSGEFICNKGEYIYHAGDRTNQIYFILKGKIKTGSIIGDEKDSVLDILTEGDLFNASVLIPDSPKNEYAYAMENTHLSSISRDKLISILDKYTEFNVFIMKTFSEKVEEKQNRLESLIFKNSRTRILEFLIKSIQKKGQRVGYEWVLRHFYTHQDIASLTSTSRQSVTTLLNELRKKNIIHFDRKRLLVRDLEQLQSLIKEK